MAPGLASPTTVVAAVAVVALVALVALVTFVTLVALVALVALLGAAAALRDLARCNPLFKPLDTEPLHQRNSQQ